MPDTKPTIAQTPGPAAKFKYHDGQELSCLKPDGKDCVSVVVHVGDPFLSFKGVRMYVCRVIYPDESYRVSVLREDQISDMESNAHRKT